MRDEREREGSNSDCKCCCKKFGDNKDGEVLKVLFVGS